MVDQPVYFASAIALVVLLLGGFAERMHAKRVGRIAYLLYGETEKGSAFARFSPLLRCVAMAGCIWGLVILLLVPAEVAEIEPDPDASKHLLICLDASPSMFLEDSGPKLPGEENAQQRIVRAGDVMRAILDRIDAEKTRVTVFGVYTRAVPILEETFDKSVVDNLFDGLPIFAAFEQGETKLSSSVSDAVEYARRWPAGSTLLLIVSDGDSNDTTPIRAVPKSIAETLVIGVGKTNSATTIAGHASKQDAASLRRLASELRGTYFDANQMHLPTSILDRLAVVQPRVGNRVQLRDAALIIFSCGAVVLAALVPLLSLLGTPRQHTDLNSIMTQRTVGGAQ